MHLKIAFYTPGSLEYTDYKRGNLLGIEYQVFGLARELAKRDLDVYVFRRWPCRSTEYVDGFNIVNVPSTEIPDELVQKVPTKVLYSMHLMNYSKHLNPDVMILTDVFSSFCLARLENPKVLVTHNPPADLSGDCMTLKKWLSKSIEERIFNKCDLLIALNSAIERHLRNEGHNTILIPNGIQIDAYDPSYLNDANYVLFGGRFVKIKGLHYLIAAYSQMTEKLRQKYSLLIVGYGPEENRLRELALNLGISDKVHFIPWLSKTQLKKIIQNSTVVVSPSLSETSGIFVLESMACGKPVIVSDIPAMRDLITHMRSGVLFKKGDVRLLRSYLELLLQSPDLRSQLGRNARKTVERNYSFEKVANRYTQIFQKCIEKH
jgi:glycosyltransferase involved in cell wall biosynthesis